MITEDYVTFEQAKLLKEKGFPQDVCNKIEVAGYELGYPTNQLTGFARPTLSLVAKWLREERNIHIDIEWEVIPNSYTCYIHEFYTDFIHKYDDEQEGPQPFSTYEEALSAGIDKALELI